MAEPPEQRIGDRERAEVDARLRAAQTDGVLTLVEYDERAAACYAARFRSDLSPLVADLPPPHEAAVSTPDRPPAVAAAAAPADRVPDRRSWRGRLVLVGAVAAVALGVGPGVLNAAHGSAVFGSHTVQVLPGQAQAQVGVLFGSVRVVVPDGMVAAPRGTLVFGGVECDQACAVPPGAPTVTPVEIDARGAFGGVDVVTVSEAARGEDPDRDDDEDD